MTGEFYATSIGKHFVFPLDQPSRTSLLFIFCCNYPFRAASLLSILAFSFFIFFILILEYFIEASLILSFVISHSNTSLTSSSLLYSLAVLAIVVDGVYANYPLHSKVLWD